MKHFIITIFALLTIACASAQGRYATQSDIPYTSKTDDYSQSRLRPRPTKYVNSRVAAVTSFRAVV